MRCYPLVLVLLLCSSFVTAAPKKIVLFQDGPSPTIFTATGLITFTSNYDNALGNIEYVLTEGSITAGALELSVGGTAVALGKYSGVGHVLCEGFWVTFEQKRVYSRPGGFIVTKTATQEESKDVTNRDGMLFCFTPKSDGTQRGVVLGYETIQEAHGNMKCAMGSFRYRLNGIPPDEEFLFVNTGLSPLENGRTRPIFISGTYSKKMGFVVEGEVEIPNRC